ncbi:MAG TPA: DUF433 domain-containing protein [Gaiellaceae bacterium]|nr:DUF433 domain-containing protein [Gaiellaceae bacterium]
MAEVRHMPPRGRYLAHEVGLLAGVPGHTIGQWARRGYIKSSVSSSPPPRVYSYQDIAEAMVVHDLLDHDVPHRDIKKAIESLKQYGDWPLTHAPLAVAGGRVFSAEGDQTYDVGRRGWQQVVAPENLTRIASELRRGGWAVRKHPELEYIEVDPDLLSGRPTIRGRRVPAAKVAAMASTTEGREILRDDYDLTEAEITDAERWWQATSELVAA